MGYHDPEEYPIPVAATDPLDGDLLFGIDKPDEMREKFNYEEPVGDGTYKLSKDAAATKTQLDRMARDIQVHIPEKLGPRFSRFLARTQAAMQLGINKQQMLDWFYAGRNDVDPYRIAAAGYAAEARWFATEDQPREITRPDEGRDFTPDFLKDQPIEEVQEDITDSLHLEAEPANDMGFDFDVEPANDVGLQQSDMLPIAARRVINGDDRDYSWLDPVYAVDEQPNALQADDEVTSNTGLDGKVVNVQPDGSFSVRWTGGTGNAQQTTYKQEALGTEEVKRKDTGSVSTIPALPAPTARRKRAAFDPSKWQGNRGPKVPDGSGSPKPFTMAQVQQAASSLSGVEADMNNHHDSEIISLFGSNQSDMDPAVEAAATTLLSQFPSLGNIGWRFYDDGGNKQFYYEIELSHDDENLSFGEDVNDADSKQATRKQAKTEFVVENQRNGMYSVVHLATGKVEQEDIDDEWTAQKIADELNTGMPAGHTDDD